MGKTLLVELTSKQIKLAEGIVLFVLFVSLLAGFGLLYIAVPLGLGFFLLTLLCFVAFCLENSVRKPLNDYSSAAGENLGLTGSTPPRFIPVG